VEWSRRAYDALRDAGAAVVFSESPALAHSIDPGFLRELPGWLAETLDPQA
jgi:predicted esterase